MRPLLVLTGGSKGIGLAINRKFASQGFDIITCSRSAAKLVQIKNEITRDYPGCAIYTQAADLGKKEEVLSFIDFVRSLNRPVEVLVNNAGIFLPGRIQNEPEENLMTIMNLNVYSAYYITRGIIVSMLEEKRGHIFNMCSTASITGYTNGGSYGISKFALYGMTKVLREELKESNIKVTAVLPGATLTSSWKETQLPPERFMKPDDIAEVIYNAWSLSQSAVVEEIIIRPQLGDIL